MKKKSLESHLAPNGLKSGAKLVFFAIFSSLVRQFSSKLRRMIAWDNVQLLVEVKLAKKIQMGQNQAQNQVFCYFFKFGSLVYLEIAQDDSLEHDLTTSRGKTHEKNCGFQSGSRIRVFAIFSRFHHQFLLILPKIAVWDNV